MSGEMEVMFSLTGRMHTLFRRELNRIIDIEWMCVDAAYAREIINLAYTAESEELHKLAERVEELHPRLQYTEIELPVEHLPARTESKYVASLR
jgi:hypothetical protein